MVFQTIGCRDLSRIDWLIEKATGQPYLLEVNTLPGFTSHSILPKAAAAVGIDYRQPLPETGGNGPGPRAPRRRRRESSGGSGSWPATRLHWPLPSASRRGLTGNIRQRIAGRCR